MKIYRIYYKYDNHNPWLYIKAETEEEAVKIFKDNMSHGTEITFISEAKEHQIVRSDNTLNFTIDFEKDYVCG